MRIMLKTIQFKSPFSMMVAGPSGCGKTIFVRNLLRNHKILIPIECNDMNVTWIHGQHQSLHEIPIENCSVHYMDTFPDAETLLNNKPHFIVIDDLMNELGNDAKLGNLFTKGSHHLNINVIFITQNLFHQGRQMRNISLSCHYLVLMKNTRDRSQLDVLGRQMKRTKALEEAYNDATKEPYGYLVVDFRQDSNDHHRLRTDIFPKNGEITATFYEPI